MAISERVERQIERSSWVRKMFEAADLLRQKHDPHKICDFSLGNPRLDPPPHFQEVLLETVQARLPLKHGYMANAGYPETRQSLAASLRGEQKVSLEARHVLLTCGAAGGMNVALKTLLNPGDQVLVSAPYFMEYDAYCDNHGGRLVPVLSREDFDLDIESLAAAINPSTAALILNSPNNPTGRVYSEVRIKALGEMLESRSREIGRTIYLISDEPYRKIVYDGLSVPSAMVAYRHTIVLTSFSKDLSIPGERIGVAAVHPEAEDGERLMDGMIICHRILGFVNAPALMQRVVARLQGECVDISIYKKKRDALYQGLRGLGYEMVLPQGAFYLFPKAPGGDDLRFIDILQKELVLAVPGRGFGLSGHFRLAYCVADEVIRNSLAGFKRALAAVR